MPSILAQFIEKEQQLKQLQEQMEKLKSNPALQLEIEFKERIIALMQEYNKTTKEVVVLLTPETDDSQNKPKARKQRKVKIYRNPETGETIETRGGNHKTLKMWKDKHGADTVDSWIVTGGV